MAEEYDLKAFHMPHDATERGQAIKFQLRTKGVAAAEYLISIKKSSPELILYWASELNFVDIMVLMVEKYGANIDTMVFVEKDFEATALIGAAVQGSTAATKWLGSCCDVLGTIRGILWNSRCHRTSPNERYPTSETKEFALQDLSDNDREAIISRMSSHEVKYSATFPKHIANFVHQAQSRGVYDSDFVPESNGNPLYVGAALILVRLGLLEQVAGQTSV